ncbi:MAG: T9SS type A sorting domain-containing protein, partial [Acidobacteriota bacterium]
RATVSDKAQSAQKKWASVGYVEGGGTTNAPKQYVFKNKNVQTGTYVYRLKQIDRDGAFKYSQEVEAVIAAPKEFALSQNYPNPFNPSTNVNFTLAEKSRVQIKIYDLTGREVKTIMEEEKEPGYYTVGVDGHMLSSGVYLYRLTASHGGQVFTGVKRMMLVK